jgi:hypothetical protein
MTSSSTEVGSLEAFLAEATWTISEAKEPMSIPRVLAAMGLLSVVAGGLIALLVAPYAVATAGILDHVDVTKIDPEAFWAFFKK